MSLAVLVILVGAGTALVIALVHLGGGSVRARLGDEAAVAARYRLDFPDAVIRRCFASADRYEALLLLDDGSLGLVHTFGDKSLTRHYRRDEFAAMISIEDDASIAFDPHEMTLPPLVVRFANTQARADVIGAFALADMAISNAA